MILCWIMNNKLILFLKNNIKLNIHTFYILTSIIFGYLFFILILDINSDNQRWLMYINPLVNLGFYFAGMHVGKMSIESKKHKSYCLLHAIYLLLLTYAIKDLINIDLRVFLFFPPTSLLIFNILKMEGKEIKNYKRLLLLEYFGKNSNYIFLLHYSVCYFFRNFLPYNLLYFFLCLFISLFGTIFLGKCISYIRSKMVKLFEPV